MDWMAFSVYLGVFSLVCGVGFWEKFVAMLRGNRADD